MISALLISLIIDVAPRFHMGDSGAYIATQWGANLPEERSWTYGLILGWVTRATGQLFAMPLLQILLSWAAFAFFAMTLARALGLQRRLALVLVAIGCLEPLGYYWSRAFMSDSLAQSAFVFLCGVLLLRCRLAIRFALVFVAGFVLVSFRIVYFPAVVLALIATTVWGAWKERKSLCDPEVGGRPTSDPLSTRSWGVAAVAFLCADLTYAAVNTQLTHAHRLTTNIAAMQFLAGALSPLGRDQLDCTPLTPAERDALAPLTYENRNAAEFASNGLVPLIRGHFNSTEAARPTMQRFVVNVIIHHPVGVAGLVVRQWSEFLNPVLVWTYHRRGWWSGAVVHGQPNELSDSVIQTFERWKVKPTPSADLPARNSPSLWYFKRVGGLWSLALALCATLSCAVMFIVPRSGRSCFLVFSTVFSVIYMGEISLSANDMISRYLLPISAPLFCVISVLIKFGVQPPMAKHVLRLRSRP